MIHALRYLIPLAALAMLVAPAVSAATPPEFPDPFVPGEYGETCVEQEGLRTCQKLGTMYGYVHYDSARGECSPLGCDAANVFARHATDWEGACGHVLQNQFCVVASIVGVQGHVLDTPTDVLVPYHLLPYGCVGERWAQACLRPYLYPFVGAGAHVDSRTLAPCDVAGECRYVEATPYAHVFEDSLGVGLRFYDLGWCVASGVHLALCPGDL